MGNSHTHLSGRLQSCLSSVVLKKRIWRRGCVHIRLLVSHFWLPDQSGSHPNMLSLTSHTFCQMICPYLWHLNTFTVLWKMVHATSQDAKMLIGSLSRMFVCHPLLPPYAVAQTLAHMFQLVTLRAWVCVFLRDTCLSVFIYISFFSFYRGIQHQHSGEAASHHWLSSCWVGVPHRGGCHHHRL